MEIRIKTKKSFVFIRANKSEGHETEQLFLIAFFKDNSKSYPSWQGKH